MEHIVLSSGEVEHALNKTNPMIRRQMAVEFYADLWLYSISDSYIGAASNIYYVASAVRAALQTGHREHTCQLRNMENIGLQFWCERSKEMKKHIRLLAQGFYNDWDFE